MQIENQKAENKMSFFLGKAMLSLIVAVLITVAVVLALRNISISLYKERTTNIGMLMGRVSLNIEDSLEHQWNTAAYFKNDFESSPPETMDAVLSYLSEVEDKTSAHTRRVYVIDKNARCYRSDGKSYRWKDSSVLLSDERVCSISTEEFQISSDDTHMIFVVPFDEAIAIEDKTLTHLAVAVAMDFVETFFDIEDFGENSVSFIVSDDGTQVYSAKKTNPLSDVFNVMTALERGADFYYGKSIDTVRSDIAERQSGCVLLEYAGETYFLAYEPLSTNNWTSVILVESNTFSSGARSMASSIIISVSILIIVAAAIIIAIILISNRSAKRKLKQVAEAERKANQAKTNFLSSMSHDIRTPMNAIVGMTNLAIEHIDNQPYVEACLSKVKLSSDHLLTLINDVLDISKIESDKTMLVPFTFSLINEMEKISTIIAPQIEEKMHNFELCTDDILVDYVYADQVRLSQVMVNLLSNAVKYTPNGGHIRVALSSKEQADKAGTARIVYTVEDNGIGMSEEFQKDMYSAFMRENNTPQNKIQGSGLGLSICKQIVDLMGGSIACRSEVGKGTVFTVTVDVPVAEAPPKEQGSQIGGAALNSLDGLKVLVAEDNDFNWEISRELLKMNGMEAVRAVNGKECLEIISDAEDGEYDLILMDIQMPVMNGYESSKAIRKSERAYLGQIPIIAVTADAFAEDIQNCMEAGMDAHIAKPIDPQKLLEAIRRNNGGRKI